MQWLQSTMLALTQLLNAARILQLEVSGLLFQVLLDRDLLGELPLLPLPKI